MKYRLKKDLPLMEAGTKIKISDKYRDKDNDLPLPIVLFRDAIYIKDQQNLIDELISEGWIEEIKPREFWLYPSNDCPPYGVLLTEEWTKGLWGVIKVREVMED